jgi:hypothetical protein
MIEQETVSGLLQSATVDVAGADDPTPMQGEAPRSNAAGNRIRTTHSLHYPAFSMFENSEFHSEYSTSAGPVFSSIPVVVPRVFQGRRTPCGG